MGEDHANAVGLSFDIVGALRGAPGPGDTKTIAREMLAAGAELIVFAGGDGTARDMPGDDSSVIALRFPRPDRPTSNAVAADLAQLEDELRCELQRLRCQMNRLRWCGA